MSREKYLTEIVRVKIFYDLRKIISQKLLHLKNNIKFLKSYSMCFAKKVRRLISWRWAKKSHFSKNSGILKEVCMAESLSDLAEIYREASAWSGLSFHNRKTKIRRVTGFLLRWSLSTRCSGLIFKLILLWK
jgi:hypothetical protein